MRPCLAAVAALLLVAARVQGASAQPVSGFYIDGGAGANFLQEQTTKPSASSRIHRRTYGFDPDAAIDLGVGYGFGDGIRVELEGNFLDSSVSGVRGFAVPAYGSGSEQRYGVFVNAYYDFDIGFPVFPYVGAGIGYQLVTLDGVTSNVVGAPLDGDGNETTGNFAYQGIVGLSYPLSAVPGLSVTGEYRISAIPGRLIFPRTLAGGPTSNVDFGNMLDHQVLIGVRYAFGAPPPAAPPAAPIPTPVPAAAAVRTYLVFFDWDRADLTDRARQIIAEAAGASTHIQTTRIEVNGYTDRSGTPPDNQRLSVRRAETVAAELARDGVPRSEIAIQGFGETHPLVATAAGIREPQNRRVEIIER